MNETERLFSYGTLQTESVQLSTFGRRLDGGPDALVGYCLRMIKIEDQDFVAESGTEYHRNLEFTGSTCAPLIDASNSLPLSGTWQLAQALSSFWIPPAWFAPVIQLMSS